MSRRRDRAEQLTVEIGLAGRADVILVPEIPYQVEKIMIHAGAGERTRGVDRRWVRDAVLVASALTVLTLAGCAAGTNNVAHVDAPHIAGFWLGLWQGLICPITFLISLFTDQVSIYDVHNNGNWYDFGFVLGLVVSFGSPGRGRPSKGRRRGSTI
jgi:hypothetical protein